MTLPAEIDVSEVVRKNGRRCVQHIAPLATVGSTEHRQTRAGKMNINCPSCGKAFASGAVVNSQPEYVRDYAQARYTGWMVTRRLYCDHQNIVIGWNQACDQSGLILREEIGTWWIHDRAAFIEKFLRDHPEAAGVAQ